MVKDLHNAGLSNAASLEIFHSIFSGQVDRLHLGDGVGDKVSFLADLSFRSLLEDIYLVADEDFDRDLASPLALSDPLLDPLEGGSLGHIE